LLEHAVESLRSARPELSALPPPAISGAAANQSAISPWWPKLLPERRPQSRSPAAPCRRSRAFRCRPAAPTESAEHLQGFPVLAQKQGMSPEQEGLDNGRRLIAATEKDIYHALGLPFIAPEAPRRDRMRP